ncbi:MAG TPA: glycoside hydrolase family 18 protein, partial [Rhodanobacteraceae bacterium]|nr:glycoside hydrolase family 18 protein [Rhodanobacteraceae bacterium]
SAAASPPPVPTPAHYLVVGYDTVSHGVGDMDVDKIDLLIFAFATIDHGRVVLDATAAQRLQQLVALKRMHPRLKVAVSVGGWGAGGFSEAARTDAGRRLFADSVARLLATSGADGLDVDWEYPLHAEAGIAASPADRANFSLLLQAVRASLDRVGAAHGRQGVGRYTLSIAAADSEFVDGIDIAAVAPLLDWFNLMTYDFDNSLTPTTGHHAGLYASDLAIAGARTTDRAVRQFLAAGVPARKLLIGVAFYGLRFDDVRAQYRGLYQPYGHFGTALPWPQLQSGFIGKHGYVRYWDANAQAPYLWNAATRSFISYDDPQSIAAKAAYVKAHRLGGIMYWEESQDPRNELLDAIWNGLQQ